MIWRGTNCYSATSGKLRRVIFTSAWNSVCITGEDGDAERVDQLGRWLRARDPVVTCVYNLAKRLVLKQVINEWEERYDLHVDIWEQLIADILDLPPGDNSSIVGLGHAMQRFKALGEVAL